MIPVYPIDCTKEPCDDPLKQTGEQATILLNIINVILDDIQLRLKIQAETIVWIQRTITRYIKYRLTKQYNLLTKVTDYLNTHLENQLTEQQVLLNIVAPGVDYTQINVQSVFTALLTTTEPQPGVLLGTVPGKPAEVVDESNLAVPKPVDLPSDKPTVPPQPTGNGNVKDIPPPETNGQIPSLPVQVTVGTQTTGAGIPQGTPQQTPGQVTFPPQVSQPGQIFVDAKPGGGGGNGVVTGEVPGTLPPGTLVAVCVQGVICGQPQTSIQSVPDPTLYEEIQWSFPDVKGEDE